MKSKSLLIVALFFCFLYLITSCSKKQEDKKKSKSFVLVGNWKPCYEEEYQYKEDGSLEEYSKSEDIYKDNDVLSFDATGFKHYKSDEFLIDSSRYWVVGDTLFAKVWESGAYISYAQLFKLYGDSLRLDDGPFDGDTYYSSTTYVKIK